MPDFQRGFELKKLLGNNRAMMARRFDRAFTTVSGIAVTMIALVRASQINAR
jgi:hypothetical protein